MTVPTCLITVQPNIQLENGGDASSEGCHTALGAGCGEGGKTETGQRATTKPFFFSSERSLTFFSDSGVEF